MQKLSEQSSQATSYNISGDDAENLCRPGAREPLLGQIPTLGCGMSTFQAVVHSVCSRLFTDMDLGCVCAFTSALGGSEVPDGFCTFEKSSFRFLLKPSEYNTEKK